VVKTSLEKQKGEKLSFMGPKGPKGGGKKKGRSVGYSRFIQQKLRQACQKRETDREQREIRQHQTTKKTDKKGRKDLIRKRVPHPICAGRDEEQSGKKGGYKNGSNGQN